MSRLNGAQLDVLKAVSAGEKPTSNVTRNGTVSGVAAKGLENKGLVTIKAVLKKTAPNYGQRVVKITAAGKKALAKA